MITRIDADLLVDLMDDALREEREREEEEVEVVFEEGDEGEDSEFIDREKCELNYHTITHMIAEEDHLDEGVFKNPNMVTALLEVASIFKGIICPGCFPLISWEDHNEEIMSALWQRDNIELTIRPEEGKFNSRYDTSISYSETKDIDGGVHTDTFEFNYNLGELEDNPKIIDKLHEILSNDLFLNKKPNKSKKGSGSRNL